MTVRIAGRGYLGSFLGKALGIEPEDFRTARFGRGDIVINCVGYTGKPNIDACEDHIIEAYESNVSVPLELMRRAGHVIHFSTGCFFQGDPQDGFHEDESPSLLESTYCWTKWQAECALQKHMDATILRIRMPLSEVPHDRNLITKVRRYDYVIDLQNSVTYLPDLADVMPQIIDKLPQGIFHVTSPDTISPAELNPSAMRVTSLEGLTRVPRSNCRLSVAKLEKLLGRPLPPLRPRLPGILAEYDRAFTQAAS